MTEMTTNPARVDVLSAEDARLMVMVFRKEPPPPDVQMTLADRDRWVEALRAIASGAHVVIDKQAPPDDLGRSRPRAASSVAGGVGDRAEGADDGHDVGVDAPR